MVVGVDVHKRSHAAALLDGNGVVLAALTIPNSLAGVECLLGWLNEHDAREAVIGIENAAGYGREQLGPALEPELIRALALLEGLRRQSVYDRTQAIQRLRAIWTQVDPEGEARVIHCQRQRELRKLTRIAFGAGIAEQAAARCIRELAREIERLNDRIATLSSMNSSSYCASAATRLPTWPAPELPSPLP